ncbi:hypothetical protein PMIN07_007364 [Paraphaeosphaeria minitans]
MAASAPAGRMRQLAATGRDGSQRQGETGRNDRASILGPCARRRGGRGMFLCDISTSSSRGAQAAQPLPSVKLHDGEKALHRGTASGTTQSWRLLSKKRGAAGSPEQLGAMRAV